MEVFDGVIEHIGTNQKPILVTKGCRQVQDRQQDTFKICLRASICPFQSPFTTLIIINFGNLFNFESELHTRIDYFSSSLVISVIALEIAYSCFGVLY